MQGPPKPRFLDVIGGIFGGDDVQEFFYLVHHPMVPYPNSRDVSGIALDADLNDNDFFDALQAQIAGGISGKNINFIRNRLNQSDYFPGWPEVSWVVPNPNFDEEASSPIGPPDPNNPEYLEDVEIPEVLEEAFPGVALRYAGVDFNDDEFEFDLGDTRRYAANYGVDATFVLSGLWNEIPLENREFVDNVFFSPVIRMWDPAEPAKHYLFDFYMAQYNAGLRGIQEEEEQEALLRKAKEGKLGPYVEEELKPTKRTGVRVISENWQAYAGYSWLEYEEFPPNTYTYEVLKNSNKRKLNRDGSVRETFYASTVDILLTCGYLANTQYQVQTFLATGETQRAEPLVFDEHPNRNYMRVDSPVRIRTFVEVEDGSTQEVTTLYPGRLYERLGPNLLRQFTPGIDAEGTPEDEEIDLDFIAYYKIKDDGYERIKVYFPRTGIFIDDAQTNVADRIVTFDINHVQAAAVPFFPGLVEEYRYHDKSDVFAACWHVSITMSDVQIIETSWWQALLFVAAIVFLLWFPPTGIQAFSIYAAANAALVILTGLVITKIAFGLFKENPLIATAILIAYGAFTGQYTNVAALFRNLAVDLPKLLVEFLDLLQKAQQIIYSRSLQDDIEEIQQIQGETEALRRETVDYISDPIVDPTILFESITTTTTVPEILYPEDILQSTEEFLEMGFNSLDPGRFLDMNLEMRGIS